MAKRSEGKNCPGEAGCLPAWRIGIWPRNRPNGDRTSGLRCFRRIFDASARGNVLPLCPRTHPRHRCRRLSCWRRGRLDRSTGKYDEAQPDAEFVKVQRVGRFVSVAVLVLSITYCLRALRSPSVGFDARLIWFLRAGWLLESHDRALTEFAQCRSFHPRGVPTSGQFDRRCVVVYRGQPLRADSASCHQRCKRVRTLHSSVGDRRSWVCGLKEICGATTHATVRRSHGTLSLFCFVVRLSFPWATSLVIAVALTLTTFGVVGPFATNGYADPLWSIAAVGAVTFGLILPQERWMLGVSSILTLVAGETKVEGTVVAGAIMVLVIARWVGASRSVRHRKQHAALVGVAGAVVLSGWPVLMKLLGSTGGFYSVSLQIRSVPSRLQPIYDAIEVHLHIVPLAIGIAVAGSLCLPGVRKGLNLGNDFWAWGALAAGTVIVTVSYFEWTGDAYSLLLWLKTSVHRVTEFSDLMAWWIIGVWLVIACSALANPDWRGTAANAAGFRDSSGATNEIPQLTDR